MFYKKLKRSGLNIQEQSSPQMERYLNPNDINLPPGYTVEVFAQGLDAPSCMVFNEQGDILIGESGYISKKPSVLRLREGSFEVIADGFEAPLTGLCLRKEDIYVSHLGRITVIKTDGTKRTIIGGLPSQGDFWNSRITFGNDDKFYFGQGTTTNSGVVGTDNRWILDYPCVCDTPGAYIMLNGQNFETKEIYSTNNEIAYTGAFSPYGVYNMPFEVKKGAIKASGSVLRANPDGSELELVAWGFRFIPSIKFDRNYRLFVANQGYDVRGSRPIANAPDEFHLVTPGQWYGWPDYAGGEAVTSTKFKPEGGVQPEFLITNHPNVPPFPYVTFPTDSYIIGFDFNYNRDFGPYGDAYIAEFGMGGEIMDGSATPFAGKGHRISKIDMNTR